MPPLAPAPVVTGAPRIPLPFGLLSVLSAAEDSTDRWQVGGVTWETLSCDLIDGFGAPECDPEGNPITGLPRLLENSGGTDGVATTFSVYGSWNCSPISNSQADASARAREQLLAREEARVEQAFWTGDLGNVPNLSGANGYAAPIDLGSGSLENALALVEAGLGRQYGSLGVIHMSRYTASLLKNRLESRGGRMYTRLGTPVVVGAGYPDVPQIIGTGALFGYRSEIQDVSNRDYDLLNRGTNDLTALAERDYLIGFDPCPVMSATYTEGGGGAVDPATLQRITDLEAQTADLEATKADVGAAPTAHTHAAADIASGTLAIARIPTGTTATTVALGNHTHTAAAVGAAPASHTHTIANVTSLQTTLDSKVDSVTAGTGVTVDNTDPANPVVSAP